MHVTSSMLRRLQSRSLPFQRIKSPCRAFRPRAEGPSLASQKPSSVGAFHNAWRIRVFDHCRERNYAVDLGYFPNSWFLGPSAFVAFSRSDGTAGRPNSFKVPSKQLASLQASPPGSGQDVDVAVANEALSFRLSDNSFKLSTHTYGALLLLRSSEQQAERQLSKVVHLSHKDMSCLNAQAQRLPVSYSFTHPAGYHEEGTALAHVQHIWGDTIVPHSLTCLGYQFKHDGYIQTILDMTVAGEPFAIEYQPPKLCWSFLSSEPDTLLSTEVEAEYGKFKITARQGSHKLIISASAPHRTFDLLSVPTQQGFQEKGIQTFNGTANVEAFQDDKLVDSQVVEGVNMQFGAAYAETTVQRMTAQQYSSPLRYKGKGVTR